MHGALRQPRQEGAGGDAATAAVGLRLGRIAIVYEHQVQVRAVAHLQPAAFAVGDHRELGVLPILAQHPAVILAHLATHQVQGLGHHHFGQPGEMVADLHQWQCLDDFSSGDPQGHFLPVAAQRIHQPFGVSRQDLRAGLVQLARHGGLVRRLIEAAGVQQHVQHCRRLDDEIGDPGAGGGEPQQLLARGTAFPQ